MSIVTTQKKFNNLCTPAQIYVVTSLLGLIIYIMNMNILKHLLTSTLSIVIHILFMLLWTYGLNILCKYKLGKVIAWFIALTPIILIVIYGLLFVHLTNTLDMIDKVDQHDDDDDDGEIEGLKNQCDQP